MRKTDINKDITRHDVKVGDKIVISREVTVQALRETTIHDGVGKPRRPITIVDTGKDSIGLTSDESVKLLERDEETFQIPTNAVLIAWKDNDGYDHYARRNEVSDEWKTSQNGPKNTYTTAALVESIEANGFDGYQEGSFEVLKRKSNFASGGFVPGVTLGRNSMDILRDALSARQVAVPGDQVRQNIITGTPVVP